MDLCESYPENRGRAQFLRERERLFEKKQWSHNYVLLSDDRAIAYSLKVASTSIRRSLNPTHPIGPVGAPTVAENPHRRVILFVRHPIDRLVSVWRHFCHSLPKNKGIEPLGHLGLAHNTPLDKVLEISLEHFNPHWGSQYIEHSFWDGRFLPNECYRFDHIGEIWPQILPNVPLIHENKSRQGKDLTWQEHWDRLRCEGLKQEYEELLELDFALYASARTEVAAEKKPAGSGQKKRHYHLE